MFAYVSLLSFLSGSPVCLTCDFEGNKHIWNEKFKGGECILNIKKLWYSKYARFSKLVMIWSEIKTQRFFALVHKPSHVDL